MIVKNVYTYIDTPAHTYTHAHAHMHIYTRTYSHTHTHQRGYAISTRTLTSARITHNRAWMYKPTHIHTNAQTHTHLVYNQAAGALTPHTPLNTGQTCCSVVYTYHIHREHNSTIAAFTTTQAALRGASDQT